MDHHTVLASYPAVASEPTERSGFFNSPVIRAHPTLEPLGRHAKRCLGIALALACAACAVPGMQMNATAPDNENPGGEPSADLRDRADLYPLNSKTVLKAAQDAKAMDAAMRINQLAADTEPWVYKLGPQDILRITVWDHPEITNPSGTANELSGRVINSDGTFFFPFVGKVMAEGKTVQDIRDQLAKGLSSYLKNPQIDVSVLQYRSKRVFVAGEVRNQGQVPLTDVPVRVTDVISQAGGLTPEADLSGVTITRDNRTYKVDLYSMYYNGALGSNVRLQEGDVVNIPDRRFNKVFVLGEVGRPNSLPMPRGRLSLAEALSDSGGVSQLTAQSSQIYVIRGGANGKPQIYHLNASTPEALVLADRFDLRARDVVFVDAAPVVRWGRVVNNILPSLDVTRLLSLDASRAVRSTR